MSPVNALLFELMRASHRHDAVPVLAATVLAACAAPLCAFVLGLVWFNEGRRTQAELLQALACCVLASLPSLARGDCFDTDTSFIWGLSLGLLPGRRLAWMGFPGLALGLLTGWCKIYLGRSLPLSVAAAMAPAAIAVCLLLCSRTLVPLPAMRLVRRYHRVRRALHRFLQRSRPSSQR